MKRIFTAVDISAKVRCKVSDYIDELRREFSDLRVGWERPEKLHLTLKFLGDVDDGQLQDLNDAARETAKRISAFDLRVSKTGVFASAKNARILWLGVEDETGSLPKLNELLESACEEKGFLREKRSFKPHLTIARIREPRQSKELIERHLQNDFQSNEFTISEIVIYQSQLQKSGSVYAVNSKHELRRNLSAAEHR
jgi:2'-5' RNA ligase